MRNGSFKELDVLGGSRSSILAIDDDEALLDTIMDILVADGHRVMVAHSGYEGLRRYETFCEELDLVILDLEMPGLHGNEVYEKIKAGDPDAKILICSGNSRDDVAGRCSSEASKFFLQKPFTKDELCMGVRDVLNGYIGSEGRVGISSEKRR